jgi:hypothetical protein
MLKRDVKVSVELSFSVVEISSFLPSFTSSDLVPSLNHLIFTFPELLAITRHVTVAVPVTSTFGFFEYTSTSAKIVEA